MTNEQHTPGPWEFTESSDSTYSVHAPQTQWPDRPDIRDTVAICPSPRVKADARLIAAAPDLLAALDRLQANPSDPRAHRQAFDAMKAARGQQEAAQ